MKPIAALPMYDWPEVRDETDAEWAALRAGLEEKGIDTPEHLVRRNADMPAVPGGICDRSGQVIAPDPAMLPPDGFDMHTLWRHPALVLGQTCWGPLEVTGLADHVRVTGQPDYSAFEGGHGAMYRSAIVMRRDGTTSAAPPADDLPLLPTERLRGLRFAFNEPHSMSGYLAIARDLDTLGAIPDCSAFTAFWSSKIATGGHRNSVIAVAEGRADVATIDCRTLSLCRRFEPAMAECTIVGWTALRKGLPYISAKASPIG